MISVALLLVALAPGAAGAQPSTGDEDRAAPPLPAGLEVFLEARQLEAAGMVREAAERYQQAMELAPEVAEIRISLAALLQRVGLSERVVELLENDWQKLDWFGRRVYAMALANVIVQRPERAPEALEVIEQLVDERADDPQLETAKARVLHRMGRVAEAETVIAELRAARGGGPRLASYHGRLLEELGHHRKALDVFASCEQAFRGCREGKVDALMALGRLGEAGQVLYEDAGPEELDQLLKAAAMLYDGGRSEQALEAVGAVLTAAPDSPRARTLEALILTDMGRLDEAVPKLRRLLRSDRDNPDLLVATAWAVAARGEGDLEEARELIGRAWEVASEEAGNPVATRVCLTAARIELAAGQPRRAREWLGRVSEPGPSGRDLLQLTAETYRRTGDWRDGVGALLRLQPRLGADLRPAAVALESEFRLRAGDARGHEQLERLVRYGELPAVMMALQAYQVLERWPDVARSAATAAERFPDERGFQFARAAALERQGEIDTAAEAFQALLRDDPEDADAANYLGYMWADRGVNLKRSLELIQMAVTRHPENAAFLDSLGWVHYRLGNLDEAEHWLRRSIALGGGGDGTVLAHLGEVLFELGRAEEARDLLERALDLGPENPEVVRDLLDRLGDGS